MKSTGENKKDPHPSALPHPVEDEVVEAPSEGWDDMLAGMAKEFVTDAELARIGRHHRAVCEAAAAFERRWMLISLRRVDADLAARLAEQRALTDRAFVVGLPEDVDLHAPAMVRGWNAAVRAMETAGVQDDAYLVGFDPKTGFRVAISDQKSAADRVTEVLGKNVVFVSPDEVAAILAGLEQFKTIAAIKRMFPGAEIIDRYADEPAKNDL